jgi:hypothetical protein
MAYRTQRTLSLDLVGLSGNSAARYSCNLYCPDLAPLDYHVFSPIQDISTERYFTTDTQKQEAMKARLVGQTKIFFLCV